jgi:hypothetical protein
MFWNLCTHETFVGGILGHNLLLSLAFFRWESLRGWDFLGHNLLLSRASFFTMEFRLSRSLSHKLFSFFMMGFWLSRSLSHELSSFFSRWDYGYHEAFITNFFPFFTVGFWLSRSLSHELFSFFTMGFWKYAIWGKTLFIHISQRVFT